MNLLGTSPPAYGKGKGTKGRDNKKEWNPDSSLARYIRNIAHNTQTPMLAKRSAMQPTHESYPFIMCAMATASKKKNKRRPLVKIIVKPDWIAPGSPERKFGEKGVKVPRRPEQEMRNDRSRSKIRRLDKLAPFDTTECPENDTNVFPGALCC